MHLNLLTTLKSFLHFGSQDRDQAQRLINQDDHEYARGHISTRGPCPGLNALANQGYLSSPRDGTNITIPHVEAALMTALHCSPTLAFALSNTLNPLCRKDGTFDLVDMRRHNVIEHDRSLTRLDFRQGDNYSLQPQLLAALLERDAKGGPVTVATLARSYRRRKKECKEAGPPSLPLNLWFVNILQTVSFLYTAQIPGRILPREVVKTFYEEEKVPDIIISNEGRRTLLGLVGTAFSLLTKVILGS